MSRMDTSAILAKEMAGIVRSHVAEAIAPLQARIKELESRPLAKDGAAGVSLKSSFKDSEGFLILTLTNGEAIKTEIRDGRDGKDGSSVTEKDIAPLVTSEVEKQVAKLPPAKDGKDGLPGKDADPEIIKQMVRDAIVVLPKPKDGKDGADGKSVTVEELQPLIASEVEKKVALIPVPKDGKDGIDGKDGLPGRDGEPGRDGRDGEGIKEFDTEVIDDGHTLLLKVGIGDTMHKHEIPLPVGPAGKDGRDGFDGKDGKDGAPGLNGKDADPHEIANIVLPEIKTFLSSNPIFKGEKGDPGRDGRDGTPGGPPGPQGERGEPGKSFVDAGVFESGKSYVEGNGVTFGGSYWICKRDTAEKPGESDAWRLAVKRGRDGRDAVR